MKQINCDTQVFVSVIVPVYNNQQYLRRCLDSLVHQTLKQIEIIVIDDGSTDNSKSICQEYQQQYANIIFKSQKNAGPSAARNNGIAMSRGTYIAFVDSDDYIELDAYRKLYEYATSNMLDLVVFSHTVINGSNQNARKTNYPTGTIFDRPMIRENILKNVLKCGGGEFASLWNKLYKAEIIKNNSIKMPLHRNYGEDWFFNQLVLTHLTIIGYQDEPFYSYCNNSNSIMQTYRNDLFELHLDSRAFLKERMIDWELTAREDIKSMNQRFCEKIFEAITNEFSPRNAKKFKDKIAHIQYILNHPETQAASLNNNGKLCRYISKKKLFILCSKGYYLGNIKPTLYRWKSKIKGEK